MNEPGSGWSFGINIHYTPEHSKLFSEISRWLCQIKSLELWIGIPHRHLILDSSPRYEALYSLSYWDTDQFKAFERVHEALQRTKEFSHVPGDIWVKIVENSNFLEEKENNTKIEEKFSLIGYSPWIGSEFQDIANKVEEKAKDLVMKNEMDEKIQQINNRIDIQESNNEKTYISYKDAITSWGLFATMLTLVLTVLMIFIRELIGEPIEISEGKFLTMKEIIILGAIAGSAMIVVYQLGIFTLKRLGIIKKKYFDSYE